MSVELKDRTLKALSLLLSYPTRDLQRAMPEIGGVLAAETRLTAVARRDLPGLGRPAPLYLRPADAAPARDDPDLARAWAERAIAALRGDRTS